MPEIPITSVWTIPVMRWIIGPVPMSEPAEISWTTDMGVADWIRPRISPAPLEVGWVVPTAFESYARVLHPAWQYDQTGERRTAVRWHTISEWSGLELGHLSQFHSVAMPQREGLPTPPFSDEPGLGTLDEASAHRLTEILRRWTSTPDECWFGLTDGYPWPHEDGNYRSPDPVPAKIRSGPTLGWPNTSERYLLYRGNIEAALLCSLVAKDHFPNLWWPEDRRWFVTTNEYLSWTYVGGPSSLIEELVNDSEIEVLRAESDDPVELTEPWVTHLVDDAIEELFSTGAATITVVQGTVDAELERSMSDQLKSVSMTATSRRWGRRGSLRINLDLPWIDDEWARRQAKISMTESVVMLAG
jgi:hypothetical protein